jgi:hypothetical protein
VILVAHGARPPEWPDYLVSLDAHQTQCNGDTCNDWVQWGRTKNGKRIAMNPEPNPETGKLECHWTTCPDAKSFRR